MPLPPGADPEEMISIMFVMDETTAAEWGDPPRSAAVAAERAEGSGPELRADEALDLWLLIHSGAFTVVDHFERSGRRYLVARRNPAETKAPALLTRRERQVLARATLARTNKQIASELGLSTPTVATHLARAMKKLGTSSRVELIDLVGRLCA